MTVKSSTFYNNAHGGAIAYSAGNVTVRSCTFKQNVLSIFNIAATGSGASIGNSIFDDGAHRYQTSFNDPHLTSAGYNLSTGDSVIFTATDKANADPKLDPNGLQYHGGYTDTIAVTAGSDAIDAGNSFGASTDQTGNARTVNNPNIANVSDGTDIGAYESPADPLQGGTPSFIVTSLDDHDDGVCGGTDCTLREAIEAIEKLFNPVSRTITFAPALTGTSTLQSALNITTDLEIDGPGARSLNISGGSVSRVLNVTGGTSSVNGVTIRNGNYITVQNHGETRQGGAVYNQASLTFNNCAFVGNFLSGASNVTNGGNGGTGQGAAIFNGNRLTLNNCTFSANTVGGAHGAAFSAGGQIGPGGNGGAAQGAAVFNDTSGTLSINACTFNGNTALGGKGGSGTSNTFLSAGGNANGGAVFNQGNMTVTSATVSRNTGTGGAGDSAGPSHGPHGSGNGGLSSGGGTSSIANTIVAANTGNTAPDAEGTFSSTGFNLIGIGDQSSGWNGPNTFGYDQVGTTAAPINPQLGSLQNNGGPTDTMALLSGSPAIDQGISYSLTTDQRGYRRPFDDPYISNAQSGDGSDIGAFELTLVLPTSAVSQKTHPSSPPVKGNISLPLTGPVGIECRSGGTTGDHQLIVTFASASPVMVNGSPQAQATTGTGQIGTGGTSNGGHVTVSGGVVTVPLTNVANAQRIVVTLFGVSDGTNTNDVSIPMGVLLGDVNANGVLTNADVSLIKAQVAAGASVDLSNFRDDVNANGVITNADVSLTKAQVAAGAQLP